MQYSVLIDLAKAKRRWKEKKDFSRLSDRKVTCTETNVQMEIYRQLVQSTDVKVYSHSSDWGSGRQGVPVFLSNKPTWSSSTTSKSAGGAAREKRERGEELTSS